MPMVLCALVYGCAISSGTVWKIHARMMLLITSAAMSQWKTIAVRV